MLDERSAEGREAIEKLNKTLGAALLQVRAAAEQAEDVFPSPITRLTFYELRDCFRKLEAQLGAQ